MKPKRTRVSDHGISGRRRLLRTDDRAAPRADRAFFAAEPSRLLREVCKRLAWVRPDRHIDAFKRCVDRTAIHMGMFLFT